MNGTLVPELRQRIGETLDPILEGSRRLALLEFPAHSNVGDSAIWCGEIRYLRQRGITPVYTGDIGSYSRDSLAAVGPLDAILMHGGGNLGDIWPAFLRSKIRVLQDFPDIPIVQLPQTVHFQDPANLDAYRRAVAAHPRFTLLARAQTSLDFARAHFDCEARLCPDMAFWLDLDRAAPRQDVVCLLRTDREAADDVTRSAMAATGDPIVDWLDEPAHWSVAAERWLTGAVARRPRRLAFLNPRLAGLRNRAAAWRVRRGCAMLSAGRVVVTDRLHGHILCVLMGIPHVLIDNSYGKLRRFYETWTHPCRDARFAGSIGEALEIARGLVSAPSDRATP